MNNLNLIIFAAWMTGSFRDNHLSGTVSLIYSSQHPLIANSPPSEQTCRVLLNDGYG
jgi:hypothetical protein